MYLYISILLGAIFAPCVVLGVINEDDERTPLNPARHTAIANDPQAQKDSNITLRDEVKRFYYDTATGKNIAFNWDDKYSSLDSRVRQNLFHIRMSPFLGTNPSMLAPETLLICEFRLKLAYLLKNYDEISANDERNRLALLNVVLDKYKSSLGDKNALKLSQKLKLDLRYAQKSIYYQRFSQEHQRQINEMEKNMDELLKPNAYECSIQ